MSTGYRPVNWAQPQLTSITVTTQTSTPVDVGYLGNAPGDPVETTQAPAASGPAGAQSQSTIYYFDSVFSIDHFTSRVFTNHPIQSGASIVYHSYQLPDRVVLEVGFSDTMQSYMVGQYSGGSGSSKSVNAYQQFVTLQKQGTQLSLATHLQTYPSMGIEEIRASDTNMTVAGAKFTIVLKQIIIVSLATTASSNRPDTSQTTSTGQQQSQNVDQSTTANHTTTTTAATPPDAPNNPNPNPDWSSDPTSQAYSNVINMP